MSKKFLLSKTPTQKPRLSDNMKKMCCVTCQEIFKACVASLVKIEREREDEQV